jgi:23S rRNA (guanosine2251-2'-O)-methyltransferase
MVSQEELKAHGLAHVLDLVSTAPQVVAEVWVESTQGKLSGLVKLLDKSAISWREVSRKELVARGGRDARMALALLHPFQYLSLPDLVAQVPEQGCVIALDSVTDPGNFGSILRSAAFFGVAGVILPERNSVAVTATVVRRSAGAAMQVPVARVTNLVRTLEELKKDDFWVYGTEPRGSRPLAGESFSGRTCFVLGAEGKGMRPLVARSCDMQLGLSGSFESLNVASFGAVLFHAWSMQKKP